MEPLRGDGVRGLTVAVVRVAVEIIPNDGDFGSWLMPTSGQKGGEWERINNRYCIQMKEATKKPCGIKNTFSPAYKQTYCEKIRENIAAETVRAECGAGYLFVTAGVDGDWWCEGAEGLWLYGFGSEVRG